MNILITFKKVLLLTVLTTLVFNYTAQAQDTSITSPPTIDAITNKQTNTLTTTQTTNKAKQIMVTLNTSLGKVELELNKARAPITVANFLQYAKKGFYDGTIFHRVIPGFMVQGGGFESGMLQKPTTGEIQNEANNGLLNEKGSIAMARTQLPHSATAQFFINVANNDSLNFRNESSAGWGYAVFGKVTKGMDIVEKIVSVETGQHGSHGDVPLEEIIIKSVTINN